MSGPFKLAVVGAGPSGFYAASRVLGHLPDASVHIFDRLWAPHGLVRYGVAPDHPDVKNCIHKFDETTNDPRVRYFGNIAISDPSPLPHAVPISLSTLFPHYTHLLLAHGAAQPITLPSLAASNTLPALSLVHWYTGHPSRPAPPPLSKIKYLTLIGHGNVSLDIARMFLSKPKSLAKLDMPSSVIDHLKTSSIRHINIVSRRGPMEAAFTAKELRELLNLPDVSMDPIPPALLTPPEGVKPTRQQSRILDLLRKGSKAPPGTTEKSWSLQFFRSPATSSATPTSSVTFDLTALDEQGRARKTGEQETQPTDFVITSLGYRSPPFTPSPSAPSTPSLLSSATSHDSGSTASADEWYNSALSRVLNASGQVLTTHGSRVHNVFTAGWASHGAKGVLGSSMYDAYDVADRMVDEYLNGQKEAPTSESVVTPLKFEHEGPDDEEIQGVPRWLANQAQEVGGGKRIVRWEDWAKIDKEEVRRGALAEKERERLSWEEVETLLTKTA